MTFFTLLGMSAVVTLVIALFAPYLVFTKSQRATIATKDAVIEMLEKRITDLERELAARRQAQIPDPDLAFLNERIAQIEQTMSELTREPGFGIQPLQDRLARICVDVLAAQLPHRPVRAKSTKRKSNRRS